MIQNSLTVINEAPPVVTKDPIVLNYIINYDPESEPTESITYYVLSLDFVKNNAPSYQFS